MPPRSRLRLPNPTATGSAHLQARQDEPVDWNAYPPAFCFQYLVSGYSVADCSKEERAALADHMWRRSQRTWRELRSDHRHGLGAEKISTVNHPKPPAVTDDVQLIAFRFCGMKAMVGFQDGRVFEVVWLDHDFTVYGHG